MITFFKKEVDKDTMGITLCSLFLKSSLKYFISLILFFFMFNLLEAQSLSSNFKYTYINLKPGVYEYIYDSEKTVPLTEILTSSEDTLSIEKDYLIDYSKSRVIFLTGNSEKIVRIEYATYPRIWTDKLSLYAIQSYSDSLKVKRAKSDIFSFWNNSSKLNISGSKSFSVSVSNQDNVTIDQSMFLKINGEISENVRIEAQLNDSQSPITPEGSSRELSSLDQVYFKVYGDEYELAFGDLELEYKNTNFINYLNKFEGMKLSYTKRNELEAALALSKSKKASTEFQGVNGKQGPYYLKVNDSNENVKVIAGTEQVYLDSNLLSRGDDYSIDYDEGTISFSIEHFISSNNRIQVIFQYSDENYRKNLYLFRESYSLSDRFQLSFHSIMQSDDKNNPINVSFSAEEKDSLREAGDNNIYVNGIEEVGAGLGKYRKVIEADLEYYVYTTIDSLAIYQISFTYVGQGYGDYHKVSPSIYEYVGLALGDYLPIKKISPPEFKANWDFKSSYFGDLYALDYEVLVSKNDLNSFSSKDSENDDSYIQNLSFSFYPEWEAYSPRLSFNFRNKNKYLYTFSEINQLQDDQFYSFTAPDSLSAYEFKSNFSYNFYKYFSHNFYYHRIHNNDFDTQNRFYSNLSLEQMKYFPGFRYILALGKQEFNSGRAITLYNNDLYSSYKYRLAELKSFYKEQLNRYNSADSIETGTIFKHKGVDLSLSNYHNSSFGVAYNREENFSLNNSWEKLNYTNTYTYNSLLQYQNNLANLKYAHKELKYLSQSSNNQNYDLLELRLNTQLWKSLLQSYINYSINNIEFFPKIRELQFVGESQGNYDSTGVWTEEGGYDWFYIQSGDPIQTIELKNDMNLVINPGNVYDNVYLKKTQFETWLLIEENTKSRENLKIYLMSPTYLMNDSLSIYAKQVIKQTVWYNLIPQKTILKYAYMLDNTLDNRYQSQSKNEKESHEWNIRINKISRTDWEYTLALSSEYDSQYTTDKQSTQHKISSRYNINNNYIFNTDLSYNLEDNKNNAQNVTWQLKKLQVTEDIMIFLGNNYRLNNKMELSYSKSDYSFTFYLPESQRKGFSYKWNSSIYYKINQYTHFNLEYSGYDYPQSKIMHQLSMEIRAEF